MQMCVILLWSWRQNEDDVKEPEHVAECGC